MTGRELRRGAVGPVLRDDLLTIGERRADLEEFRRLKGDRSGEALIAAMQASPHRDIEIVPVRTALPVRDVSL